MSEEYSVDSLDRGLRLPILYNAISSIFTLIVTLIYLTVLARILNPDLFLIYSSIYTLYVFTTSLSTRVVQWAARDYVRRGENSLRDFSSLFWFSVSISTIINPSIIILILYPFTSIYLHIFILYSFTAALFQYVINLIALISPRYYNSIFLFSISTRLIWVLSFLYLFNVKGYIIPLMGESIGFLLASIIGITINKGKINYRLFIPNRFNPRYIIRMFKLSIINYLNMFRGNLPNIHYFIAYSAGLSTLVINSLWIVYRLVGWGATFFRGFFVVIYSRQFYNRLGESDFSEYVNIISYILIPGIIYTIPIHRAIISFFNPKYIDYSYLLPISILLIFLEVIRITLLRISFGLEDIDRKYFESLSISAIFNSIFWRSSYIQLRNLILFSSSLFILLFILNSMGFSGYTPITILSIYIVEVVIDVVNMYISLGKYVSLSIDIRNMFYFIIASLPGLFYLHIFKVGDLVVSDIFTDSIPLLIQLSLAYAIYFILSLSIPWVRRDLKSLIDFIFTRLFAR